MLIPLILLNAAVEQGVSPSLLSSVCYVESSHKVLAVNRDEPNGRASIGLCQIQLRTARWLGFKGTEKELFTPKVNAKYAAKYLKFQLDRYSSNWVFAIAAYNSGSIKFNKSLQLVNQHYVDKVFRRLHASN